MDPVTSAVIMKSLDGLSARAIATAENIANAGTANYRPLRVTFESALAAAAKTGDRDAVDAVRPKLEQITGKGEEPDLRVDLELSTAAATAMRYSALIELLGRHDELETIAVRGAA